MATIKMTKNQLSAASLPVRYFREGAMFVAYCTALDLSTCGATFAEARTNIREAVALFFEECAARGTLTEALRACGCEPLGDRS